MKRFRSARTPSIRTPSPAEKRSRGGTSDNCGVRRVYPGVLTLAMFCPVTSRPKRCASSDRAAMPEQAEESGH